MDNNKNFTSRPYGAVFYAAAVILLGVLLIFGFLHHKEQLLAGERQARVQFTGSIEAEEVMLSFKLPGKIASLLVNEGDQVKKGQVVARLETEELALNVQEAKAGIAACQAQVAKAGNAVELQSGVSDSQVSAAGAAVTQAEAGLDLASATWGRIKALYEGGAVSGQQKDEAEAQYKAAQGKLEEARAALAKAVSSQKQVSLSENDVSAARAQLALAQAKYDQAVVYFNNATLTAPSDGIVTLKAMKAGEMVAAGTPVLKITDLSNTWVTVYVPETKMDRIRLGQKATVSVQSFPGQQFDGLVSWINAAGDFATQRAINDQYDHDIRSFEVKVRIANPEMRLRTGMTATVKFWEGD